MSLPIDEQMSENVIGEGEIVYPSPIGPTRPGDRSMYIEEPYE